MKALRVIKIILCVAALICLLVSCAGNYFILSDACKNKVSADEVHKALDNYDFSIGSIFKGKAEGDDPTEGDLPTDDDWDNNDESADPTNEEDNQQGENLPVDKAEDAVEGYVAGKHMGLVNGLMKAGNARVNLSFLKDLKFKLCKVGTVGMRSASEAENAEPAFEVNLWVLIGFGCLTLAFILHLFSKNCRKTVWGLILMIFGYLLFVAFFAAGHVLANFDVNKLLKPEITDFTSYRIYTVAGCGVLGFLMGLGFLRCGSRAMKRRKKKNMPRR